MSEEKPAHAHLSRQMSWRRRIRRLVLAGLLLGPVAPCAGMLSPAVAAAHARVTGYVATSLQFVNFTYLGVSRKQHGLLMELRTQSGTAVETSVRLNSGTSKKLLAKFNVGTISHNWHRFVLRVHGKAPSRGEYEVEVFQGSTYSATFYFTVH